MKKEESYYSKFKKPTPKREVVQTETVGNEMIRTRFRTK